MQVPLQVLVILTQQTCRKDVFIYLFVFQKTSMSNIEKLNLVLVLQEKLAVRE